MLLDIQQLSQYQTPQSPEPAPITPPPPRHRWGLLGAFFVLALAVSAGAYFFLSEKYAAEPVIPSYTPRDAATSWKTYTSTQYGFEFKYPGTIELNFDQFTYQIGDIPATKIVGGDLRVDSINTPFSLSVLENSLDPQNIYGTYGKIESPDLVQMGNQMGYKYREGDAGTNSIEIQTKLGAKKILLISFLDVETSEYQGPRIDPEIFVALRELQNQILSTFKFTDVADTSAWKTFTSKYSKVSFQYPEGYSVYDSQNEIAVYKGRGGYIREQGSDPAIFSLIRYISPFTKAVAEQNIGYANVLQYTVNVDGASFKAIEAVSQAQLNVCGGKSVRVIFDASVLFIIQYPDCNKDADGLVIGRQILSTFKFTP